jgi:hypothetical protein
MYLFQLSQDEIIFEARARVQGKSYLLAQRSIKLGNQIVILSLLHPCCKNEKVKTDWTVPSM